MIALLEKSGIVEATPIQKEIIPAVMEGRDVLAQSETGSGKTISFAVPIIEKVQNSDGLCALVLVPTRELCTQVTGEFEKFSQGKKLGITAVYGGVSIDNQVRKLKKTNIIIATPGRLIDLLDRKTMRFDKIKFLVLDEADRMLDMGFIKDIEKILKFIGHEVQTMLFSATVSKEITQLSKKYLYNPVNVILESSVDPSFLHQTYYQVSNEKKLQLLIHLLKEERDLALVFCNRKHITEKLVAKLRKNGIQSNCLNGDMSQSQRERVTRDFKNKKFNILIATDVASRGLHINDITHVYNYEIPKDVDSYTHRVGRTARAGKKGEAISFVAAGEDQKFFKQILFNYNGSIMLKKVNPESLPQVEQEPAKKQSSKGRKPTTKRKEPINRTKKKFVPEEDFQDLIEPQPNFDEHNTKVWNEKHQERAHEEERRNQHSHNRQGFHRKGKPGTYGKRLAESWEKPKPLIWREGSDDLDNQNRKKSYGYGKSKPFGKNRPFRKDNTFGKDKTFGKDNSFGKDKTFGKENAFGKDKPYDKDRRFGKDKPFGKDRRFGKDKPSFGKDKPSFGKESSFSKDKSYGKDITYGKESAFGKDKVFGKKSNPNFKGKKDSRSWEDRKPKFWNEGKSNKRYR